ncbi:MAG: tyrosine-type recombinase/integrase [Pseudomonadota bacterium]
MQQSGIEKGGCHLFRHAMATHMLESGAELRYIQAILGHADINTTTIYTHLYIDQLRRVHESTHPAEVDGGMVQPRES